MDYRIVRHLGSLIKSLLNKKGQREIVQDNHSVAMVLPTAMSVIFSFQNAEVPWQKKSSQYVLN